MKELEQICANKDKELKEFYVWFEISNGENLEDKKVKIKEDLETINLFKEELDKRNEKEKEQESALKEFE